MYSEEILPLNVLDNIKGQYLEAFLIAHEGWRRGLKLKWYNENNSTTFNFAQELTGRYFSLQDGENTHYFFRTRGDKVSNEGLLVSRDKVNTKELLSKNGIPVPLGKKFRITSKKEIVTYANQIGYPVVLKPLDGTMGKGVFCDIKSEQELLEHHEYFLTQLPYKSCIIEKQYDGEEHRIYVVGEEAVSCINRKKAYVIGAGVHTIKELIDLKNNERSKNPYLRDKPIKVDYDSKNDRVKYTLIIDDICAAGQKINVRSISNLSKGGEPHEVSKNISKEIKELAVKSLKSLPGVAHGGVDIIIDSKDETKGTVIEINTVAEIVFHFYPMSGEPVPIPGKIMDYYFPKTIDMPKSNFYFDYPGLIKYLDTGIVEEIAIKNLPKGDILAKNIVLKLNKVTATKLKSLRYLAIKNDISGESIKVDENTISLR